MTVRVNIARFFVYVGILIGVFGMPNTLFVICLALVTLFLLDWVVLIEP